MILDFFFLQGTMCYSHIRASGEFCKKNGCSICMSCPHTALSRAHKHLGFFHLSKKESKEKKTYQLTNCILTL